MIRHGTKPAPLDLRDYAYHRTHPHFSAALPQVLPLMEYSYDAGLTMPDQNEEGLPFGCTGETMTDLKADLDKLTYKADYTYEKTCLMEGHGTDRGCDMRTAAKSLRIYGAQRTTEKTDQEAEQHRVGAIFFVDKAPGRDWFDSFRIALRSNKQAIGLGTPWFWSTNGPTDGMLSADFVYDGNPNDYSWHAWAMKGEQTLHGEPTLLVKSWQGPHIGNKGWLNMNRETFNRAYDIHGTIALLFANARPEDIKTILPDMWQLFYLFVNRLRAIVGAQQKTVHA